MISLKPLLRNRTIRLNQVVSVGSLIRRQASSDEKQTLFDVYKNNSHWMGVYDRHPIVQDKIKVSAFKEAVQQERNRLAPIDLKKYIEENQTEWTPETTRFGAVGIKLGTTVLWTKNGFDHACTLIQIKNCEIIDTQVAIEDGGVDLKTQVIVGADDITDQEYLANMSRRKFQWYADRDVFPKKYWCRYKVTKNALALPGTKITAAHFVPGQFVRVRGRTIDQGFQGVMKRWGMKGQPKTHGQTKTHRKMGATGGGQDPGRIFPGKRMAGNVGGTNSTTFPLKILRINTKYNVLYVKGSVPGKAGNYLKVYDNNIIQGAFQPDVTPPFPTFTGDPSELEEDLFDEKTCRPSDPSLEFPPFEV